MKFDARQIAAATRGTVVADGAASTRSAYSAAAP